MSTTTPLRQRTLDTLKLGHYSERTITSYIDWLIRLGDHYHRSPAELTNEQVQDFLLYLIDERKISEWLDENLGVQISHSAIATALKGADGYIGQTVDEYYGNAMALNFYIPPDQGFSGVDVLANRSLLNVLIFEEPLVSDNMGIAKRILEDLNTTWFELPELYRKACVAEMRKRLDSERKKNDRTRDED